MLVEENADTSLAFFSNSIKTDAEKILLFSSVTISVILLMFANNLPEIAYFGENAGFFFGTFSVAI